MKHLLTILCVLTSFTALAQFPNTHTQSNPYTKEVFNGSINPKKGLVNGRYADTTAANLDYVAGEAGAQIVVGNTIYLRDNTATKWIVAGGYGVVASNITILNDSSISICNGSTCDTFSFTNIVVNNFSVVNDSTILVCNGNNVCDTLFIPPTPISKNFVDSTKIRGGDSLFYYINGNEYLGGIISPKSNISIANDSSLVICSSNRCDTFIFNDIIIDNFTVVNDSTILVCDGNNTCDTLHIAPTPLAKSYVDSVKVDGSLIYYYINGSANLAGVIGGKDGLISGGHVVWSQQGLKFYIEPAQYVLGGKFYSSPLDSVTLDPASTQSRVDLFIVDTTSHAGKITGIADGNLLTPQVDPTYQIALTSGIQINPGDTVPSNVTTDIVYSEGVKPPDWDTLTQGTPMVVNFSNTTNPHAGSKDVYVSRYSQGSTLKFVSPSLYPVTTDATLSFWIYLNGKFTNQVYAQLYDASASASAWLRITPYFNINDSGKYQLVTVPVSAFAWTNYSGNFDRVLFNLTGYDTSGVKGFYLDNIQFQKGINSIPPQTDYSNKLDSILLSNDSLFQYVKGVKTFKGLASGSGGIGGGITKLGDSPYGLIKLNDSTYLVDSTLLLTKLMAAATYLNIVDTTDKWIPVGSKFPIGVIKPIIALNDSTLRFDSLNLTEMRYSQAARDTATWTDSTVIDKKYFLDRLASYTPALSGTGFVKMAGTTPSYITSPIDSASYHTIVLPSGDSLLVFQKPNGTSDTISFALLRYWKLNINKVYYNGGNVGVGTSNPLGKFEVNSNNIRNPAIINDSTGIIISNRTPATSSTTLMQSAGPISWALQGYSDPEAVSLPQFARILPLPISRNSGSVPVYPTFQFQGAAADSIYANYATLAYSATGKATLVVAGTTLSGNTASGNTLAFITGAFSNTLNLTSTGGSSLNIGTSIKDYSNEINMATTKQGFLPPQLTTAQRDSINLTVTSYTVLTPGTGYTSTPTIVVGSTGSYGNNTRSATATATLSGTTLGSVTPVISGNYFQTPTVTVTGGGGSGATVKANVTQSLTAGTTLYNTDINALQTWNGNKWVTSGTITGTATLSSGTVTVTAPSVKATSRIYLSYNTPSGTQGFLSAPTASITAGTSFIINSSSVADNSTVNWSIIN